MRLRDAGLRRRTTKLIDPDHRPSPWLTEDAAPRSLEPIVRPYVSSQNIRPISSPRSKPHRNPAAKMRSGEVGIGGTGKPRSRKSASTALSTWCRARKRAKYPPCGPKSPTKAATHYFVSSFAEERTVVKHRMIGPNDEVERRGGAPASNEGTLSQSSSPSLAPRKCSPTIARTDC